MRVLYIGILTEGTTSRMRADNLRRLMPEADWTAIDTDVPLRGAMRPLKTMAFRLKAGPVVSKINFEVVKRACESRYDLVWVDKGIYLWKGTIDHLRDRADHLVHFTPDSAFYANISRHFRLNAAKFDLLVTTKSFELDEYSQIGSADRILLVTQSYDAALHRPPEKASIKNGAAVFIGLCEPDREACIRALLEAGVSVRLGGKGWGRFLRRYAVGARLHFLGTEIFGDRYVSEYASASVGLGLLSKRFPEMHTTRTFEIPACGTLLATERTVDTIRFFKEDEALFFNDYKELARRLVELLERPDEIEATASRGHQRVLSDGRDYASVLSGVLKRLLIH